MKRPYQPQITQQETDRPLTPGEECLQWLMILGGIVGIAAGCFYCVS